MRLITKITCNASLNAKAAALAPFLRMYYGCLMPTEDQWSDFVAQVRKLLEDLNEMYPRTKPFEVYGFTDNGVYIVPEGKPETTVASVWAEPVKAWLTDGSIVPVDSLAIKCAEKYDFR